MKIGVVCYPTFGGSGVVATELGIELSKKGHEVHFITYSQPVRLDALSSNLHYHEVNIFDEQKKIIKREKAKLDDLLNIPIADRPNWSVDEINAEISNSAQALICDQRAAGNSRRDDHSHRSLNSKL